MLFKLQTRSKTAPKSFQNAPKRLPRGSQDTLRTLPRGPKSVPRGSKILSRAPKIAKISHPEPPRAPERVPRSSKRLPRSPKTLPRASQDPQKSSRKALKTLPVDLQASILSVSNIILVLKPTTFSKHLNFLASKPPRIREAECAERLNPPHQSGVLDGIGELLCDLQGGLPPPPLR